MSARLLIALLLAFCATPAGGARAETATAPELARQMLTGLGIGLELSAIRAQALADVERQQQRVQPGDLARLRAIVRMGFDPDVLSRHVLQQLLSEIEAAEAPAATAWLAEEQNQQLFDLAHRANARCLEDLPLEELRAVATPERDPLVRGVARGTGAAGSSVRRGALVFAAMLIAGNDSLPPDKRYSAEQMRLLIEVQRASLATRHPTDLRALHCAYREVSRSRLEAACRFFASPAGRWLRSSADRAVERALIRAAEETARYIVDAFGDAPPAAPLHTAMH